MGITRQYATGCAFNTKHLFMNFPYKKLKINCEQCEKVNGDRHRDVLVKLATVLQTYFPENTDETIDCYEKLLEFNIDTPQIYYELAQKLIYI